MQCYTDVLWIADHDEVEEGWTQVARKWYGITDAHLQPDYYDTSPDHVVGKGKGFLEVDEAFMDGEPEYLGHTNPFGYRT